MTAHETRVLELQQRLKDDQLEGALVCDPDSIFYLSGYWGYASFVSCGRPNLIWIPVTGEPEIITPLMEKEMCQSLSRVGQIHGWIDGVEDEWRKPLGRILRQAERKTIAADIYQMPALVSLFTAEAFPELHLLDLSAHLAEMRMIKDADEIHVMRHAGAVAVAMAAAAEAVIQRGIPEFEVSLAAMAAGNRKDAEILEAEGNNGFDSPMIHNLQIMQSGKDTCMVHRRPTTRCICCGDPVYLCFCGITVFRGYWLGFDREFFCESVTDERARTYEVCIAAQMAALETVRPGVTAEEVHFAADAVYRDAGFSPTYRTGRGTGCSILEGPELKAGNKTALKSGMTLVIDGGITVPGDFGARVGDSIVVTDEGFEYLTPYPKHLRILS